MLEEFQKRTFQAPFCNPKGQQIGDATLLDVAVEALLGGPQDGLSGKEKLERFKLAMRISSLEALFVHQLEEREVSLLTRVGEQNLSIIGWGRLKEFLEEG